jgi:hemoglobin/transferrin/lactoferrin receptor protein
MKRPCQRWARPAVFVLILALSGSRATRAETVELDPVTVTARGREARLSLTPGSIGLLEPDDFRRAVLNGPLDGLAFVPGVEPAGDSPWSRDVNIRGLSRGSVVFLIDGCRVNTSSDINAQYGLIDPGEIDRVEILRGPVSALYGSGAMGGVVSLATRQPDFSSTPAWAYEFSAAFRDNPGGYEMRDRATYHSGSVALYGSYSRRDYDSYEDGDGTEMRNSQFADRQTSLKLGWRPAAGHTVRAQWQYYEGEEIGIPGSGTAPLPAAADVTYPRVWRNLWQIRHAWAVEGDALESLDWHVFYQSIARRARIDAFPPASPVEEIRPRADHETIGGRFLSAWRAGNHRISAGLDLWERDLESARVRTFRNGSTREDIPLPTSSFLSAGAFAEDAWSPSDALTFHAGGRADSLHIQNDPTPTWEAREETDMSWSALAGWTARLSPAWTWTGIASRAYRSPDLEERYAYLELGGGRVKLGDPDLESETSNFFETGLRLVTDRFSASVAVYYNDLENLIAEVPRDAATLVNANIDEAELYGIETEWRWIAYPGGSVIATAALPRGRDTRHDEDLPGIAPLTGSLGFRHDTGRGFWSRAVLEAAAEQDHVPPGAESTPGWQTLDLLFGYAATVWNAPAELFAGCDNVFDQTFRRHLTTSRGFDFHEPGRSLYAGLRMEF